MTIPDTFPDSPTVRAVLVRSEWGHYRASLTLPGGRTQTITSDQLDGARAKVIDATRTYLAAEVRHPGRLHVEDPEGRWLLGVPHDGGDLVPLPDLPAAPPLSPRPPARPPVLPSRPAASRPSRAVLPAPRCAGRRRPPAAGSWPSPRSRSPSCSSPAIVDLTHSTSSPRRAPAAVRSRHHLTPATHITTTPVTTARSIPAVHARRVPRPHAASRRRTIRSPRAVPPRRSAIRPRPSTPRPSTTPVRSRPRRAPVPGLLRSDRRRPRAPAGRPASHSRAAGGVRLPVPGGPPPL